MEPTGQARVIQEVRSLVDRWRGFPLGRAGDPWPPEPPRYQPSGEGERPVSETTLQLLHHWFRHEPHTLGRPPRAYHFKYWPHQRRLVETFLYLYEVRGIRRTETLWQLAGLEPLGRQRDPWGKLGGQLATGSGKTKMMSLIVAWAYLNAVREGEAHLGIGRHAVIIAPGLFVRDRLFSDFFPPDGSPSVFTADPVVPRELEAFWDLHVYSPATCPRKLDPAEGALVITNRHQLERSGDEAADLAGLHPGDRQMGLLFEADDPRRLEEIQSPLLDRFARSRGLLVINDEAHHVWDEPGHAAFEQRAAQRNRGDEEAQTAMAWIGAIRRLNGSAAHAGRVALQVDLSATLYQETGAARKGRPGGATHFKPQELFRHTAVHYGLAEAIQDGIVKRPILERVEVRNKKTGAVEPLVREGQPNAWEKYRNILSAGIERWKRVRDQLAAEGDRRKPILFILCNDRNEAREVANMLTHGEAVREDLSGRAPRGHVDPSGETLFLAPGPDGTMRSTVVEIHIGQKEQSNEEEWEKIRRAVNAIDQEEIVVGGQGGAREAVDNPYNVVVSVMMIKEGWDVRNVKVIVPLRPCDSRTLTEQALGRGLRKMHPPVIDDEGAAAFHREELYVIDHPSFRTVLDQIRDIIEEKASDEITHATEHIGIVQKEDEAERRAAEVRLVRFEGLVQVVPDWRRSFDLGRLPPLTPRVPWRDAIDDTEIRTYLRKALQEREEEGQILVLPATPSYRDFDHVIELAYALPLLRELRASFQHKNAVKGVVGAYLERKTFALPAGLPLSFERSMEDPAEARIALGNLARPEVIEGVHAILLPALREALSAERSASEAQLSIRNASELRDYTAVNKCVLESPRCSTFRRVATENPDELAVARLLDQAKDMEGWVYNHRQGVGYSIEYEWQGYSSPYYPDFIVRAKIGSVIHNFILEVKGRLDDRDKAKARRGRRYCELLTQYDGEPWHYALVLENPGLGRNDISWWRAQSSTEVADLLRHLEGLPLYPERGSEPTGVAAFRIVPSVAPDEQYRAAVPAYDLAVAAGSFGGSQAPEPEGWARVQTQRSLAPGMFVARVVGRSMEPGVPAGSWGLFRAFAAGEAPSPNALDGRRVVAELRDEADPETGGRYTLKRWRVARVGAEGEIEEVHLVPDNPDFPTLAMTRERGRLRVVAELLEVVA